MARPSRNDPSVPTDAGYEEIKDFYRSEEVADDYDRHRRGTALRKRRNRRKWAAITEALDGLEGIDTVLDLPCGTGRFTGSLADRGHRVVGADISVEMMRKARESPAGRADGVLGYVQADAEGLPFADDAVDCVMSIRFLFHVDPETRVAILAEMRRVAGRSLVLDFRHKYTWRWHKRWVARKLGLDDRVFRRVSRADLRSELRRAGLALRRVIRVGVPLFSDKWIVVAEPDEPAPPEALLKGTDLEGVEVLGRIGEGARSVVWAARWRGRKAALKAYRPGAVERHARRHDRPLAEFEHARSATFHAVPGLARHVAEPLGRVVGERGQALLQERVDGVLFAEWVEGAGEAARRELYETVRSIVEDAHRAGHHDVDLHPWNVLVTEDPDGRPRPVLFDFNALPLHARRGNPVGLLLRAGLLPRRRRDRRRLERFREMAGLPG